MRENAKIKSKAHAGYCEQQREKRIGYLTYFFNVVYW